MPREITPKALRCGETLTCPSLYEVMPEEMRCDIAASRPSIFEQENGVLVIGKIAPIPEDLKAKIGPDEALVWVPKGLFKDIEWA